MLKKLCVIIALIYLFKILPYNSLIFTSKVDSYTFFVGSSSSNCEIITVSGEMAKKAKKNIKNICGEAFQTKDKELVYSEIERLNCQLVWTERAENLLISYYYSPNILKYQTINGEKINVQVAETDNLYTMGSPLIFGSF